MSPASVTSWGIVAGRPSRERTLRWRDDPLVVDGEDSVLPYGLGRSYGDSCLNEGHTVLRTHRLDHFVAFDAAQGVLTAEAGVTLETILDVAVPRGWFLPVTPGTKQVTLGGAIANDVHGKNHHRAGTFGRHVTWLDLRRSTGELIRCSATQNADLFAATISGLGLTGLIVSAQLRLAPIPTPFLVSERVPLGGVAEFFRVSDESGVDYEHTVAWIDVAARGRAAGRGVFLRANHAVDGRDGGAPRRPSVSVPPIVPSTALNPLSIRVFNLVYRAAQLRRPGPRLEHYESFFYPLDGLRHWNRLYGRRGFYQYQCVVPDENRAAVEELLRSVAASGEASFLSVLKVFGDVPSPGIMSFPRPGPTLAMDFANRAERTLALFRRLDAIVMAAGGAIYPAKDARMSGEMFRRSFPAWERFSAFVDPAFSSSFWRRVAA